MNFFQRSLKKIKKLFTVIFVILIIFIMAIPSFAVDNSHFQYVTSINIKDDTYVIGDSSDYNGVTFTKVGGTDTRITNSNSSYKIPLTYYSPSYWVSGQTYRIEFILSASNIDGIMISLSTTPNLTEGEQTLIADNTAKVDYSYNYSFVYSGEPYLIFTFVMPAHSTCVISNIDVSTYNPNAVVESQNQQIIEQNSELNSNLFDGGEDFSVPDVDISSQLDSFVTDTDEINNFGSAILGDVKLLNGIKAFTVFFNSFWDSIINDEMLAPLSTLAYLTVFCSIILLIVGFLKERSDKK